MNRRSIILRVRSNGRGSLENRNDLFCRTASLWLECLLTVVRYEAIIPIRYRAIGGLQQRYV